MKAACMLYGEAIRLPNQISLFSDFMVKPNLSCVSSLLVNTRPGSGPRREGRPPRAHGRGGARIKYVLYNIDTHEYRPNSNWLQIAWLGIRKRTEASSHPFVVASLRIANFVLLSFFGCRRPPARRPSDRPATLVSGCLVIACCRPALNRDALTHPLHAAATFCNQQQQIVGE